MPVVSGVEEIVVKMKDGSEHHLLPTKVSKVETRLTGSPMSKHGEVTYWEIISVEASDVG